MARYEHLPIYKKAMEMSVYIEQTVRNFSRYHKYGIGGDLRDISRQILRLIIRANLTKQKAPVLQELVEACEQFKVMIVLAKELKAFQNFQGFHFEKKDGSFFESGQILRVVRCPWVRRCNGT